MLSIRQFMVDDLQGLVQNGNPFVVLLFQYWDVFGVLCERWMSGVGGVGGLFLVLLVESG